MECTFTSENDKIVTEIYKTLHGESNIYGDVKDITGEDIDDFDLLVGGFPCFPKGQKIITEQGLKAIENIQVGEKVLTHTGNYEEVLNTMTRDYNKELYTIVCKYYKIPVVTTDEHPFYTKRGWVEAKDLREDDYVGMPLNKKSEELTQLNYSQNINQHVTTEKTTKLPLDKADFWKLVGYWLAEGWTVDNRGGKEARKQYRVVLASTDEKDKFIKPILESLNIKFNKTNERTCYKYHLVNKELWLYIKQFTHGTKAQHKTIPEFVQNLNIKYLDALIEGYIAGDGHKYNDYTNMSSVSQELLEGIQRILLKTDKRLYSLKISHKERQCYIENRLVNAQETYKLSGGKTQGGCVEFTDDYVFFKIDKITKERTESTQVYNFEVDRDNSYCLPMIAVHNCQSFSINGNRKGFEGVTGSLFFEGARIATEKNPKFILMENVTGLLNHNKGETLSVMLKTLNEAGYTVDINVMKSVEFGVPQKRERIFIVGVLNHPHEEWTFDNKIKAVNKAKKTILENYPDLKTFKHKYPVGTKSSIFTDIAEKVENPVYLELGDFLQCLGKNEYRIKDGTNKGYTDFTAIPYYTTIDYTFMTSKTRRGRVKQGITKTLDQSVDVAVFDGIGWRRITPLEVFRLQGFPDEYYYKLKEAGFKEKELYARPSRSITVPVVKALGQSLLDLEKEIKEQNL